MAMRLPSTANADGVTVTRNAAHDKGRPAVRYRAAIEQLQWRGDRLGFEYGLYRNGRPELGSRMHASMLAHQHRKFCQIRFRRAMFQHVAGSEQSVVRGNGGAKRHFVDGMADLGQRLDR